MGCLWRLKATIDRLLKREHRGFTRWLIGLVSVLTFSYKNKKERESSKFKRLKPENVQRPIHWTFVGSHSRISLTDLVKIVFKTSKYVTQSSNSRSVNGFYTWTKSDVQVCADVVTQRRGSRLKSELHSPLTSTCRSVAPFFDFDPTQTHRGVSHRDLCPALSSSRCYKSESRLCVVTSSSSPSWELWRAGADFLEKWNVTSAVTSP